MYDVIAFDLDGTIIDSKPSIVYGLNKLLEHQGLPPRSTTELRQLIGLPLTDIFGILGIDIHAYETHRGYYSNHMYEHMRAHLRAFDGAGEILQLLKSANYRLALVTSRGRDSLGPCLEIAGIDEKVFDLTIAREDTKTHKPLPDPLLTTLERMSCLPERLVYVGDALVDMACAAAAGCHAIFATYDADTKLESEHQPLSTINSLHDLKELLLGPDRLLAQMSVLQQHVKKQ